MYPQINILEEAPQFKTVSSHAFYFPESWDAIKYSILPFSQSIISFYQKRVDSNSDEDPHIIF